MLPAAYLISVSDLGPHYQNYGSNSDREWFDPDWLATARSGHVTIVCFAEERVFWFPRTGVDALMRDARTGRR